MEVFVHSQPNREFAVKIYNVEQTANAAPLIRRVETSLAMARLVLPYFVHRSISSDPDW